MNCAREKGWLDGIDSPPEDLNNTLKGLRPPTWRRSTSTAPPAAAGASSSPTRPPRPCSWAAPTSGRRPLRPAGRA
eukprot:11890646-Alexandrium_andersonii.AAC.1